MKAFITLGMLLFSMVTFAQEAQKQTIDSLARLYMGSEKNRLLAIGIVEAGKKQIFSFGQAYNSQQIKVKSNEAVFELGELSSLFTTTLLARMAVEGDLNIETPLQALMPGQRLPVYQKLTCEPVGPGYNLYACDPKTNDETISILLCNLATHTAGFPANPPDFISRLHPKNPYASYTTKDLYRYLNNHPITFTSGFEYQYSHVGMALLGHSLALKTSRPYETLLQERVLQPLNLSHTFHLFPAEAHNNRIQGYTQTNKAAKPWEFDVLAPSAGLHGTIEDMMQFLAVNMGVTETEWLPAVRLAQNPRETIRHKELKGSKAGLGWIMSNLPGTTEEIIWLAGKTGGFAAYIAFTSDYTRGVVILSNQAKPLNQTGIQILKTLQAETGSRTVHAPVLLR
ncbi:serine hydrolase [Rhodocytophaga aerolata]|uniref:Serine hydrolase n=1 Tax=Rhodocytophaga aerolata TaxID=455078 RepID=A0ABT8R396_9BACT|nr:serine hydrolase [Rhodocytophaga aerolata]MDO1446581.1 serine hydrolase [Rhodocytophaga aerolata]